MAPLSGGESDKASVAAAAMLAQAFDAELAGVYVPADIADVVPWIGEGFLGGVQSTALESLKEAAAVGEGRALEALEACGYDKRAFLALQTPVWTGLSAESRLADVVVFTDEAARGRGLLAEAFQQIVADEQRPILIPRAGLTIGGVAAVAWDGGKEASRAARLALPLLEKAARVMILSAPKANTRAAEPARLQAYYAARGLAAEISVLTGSSAGATLLSGAAEVGADILVAGAFGHARLREFIFGGTTRTLLNSDRPSLFLSH